MGRCFSWRARVEAIGEMRRHLRGWTPPDWLPERPRTRADCSGGLRPCPWVGCRYHLFLEVTAAGSLRLGHPDKEPWELAESCALDVADRAQLSMAEVGELVGLARQRIHQIEATALWRIGWLTGRQVEQEGGRIRRMHVKLTGGDEGRVQQLADWMDCNKSEAVRRAIREVFKRLSEKRCVRLSTLSYMAEEGTK